MSEQAHGTLKPEFVVERQGRRFALLAGLLDLAHQEGLRSVRTQLLQIPSEDNGQLAIVHATVETSRGTFEGTGDAGPSNVARPMLTVTIRFAESRAIARALRWATNVGVAALEELGDGPDPIDPAEPPLATPAPAPVARQAQAPPPSPRPPAPAPTMGEPASPAQIKAIYAIGKGQFGWTAEQVVANVRGRFHVEVDQLTKRQAYDYITELKGTGTR